MTLPQLAMELLKVNPDDISAADMESARRKLSHHGAHPGDYIDLDHIKAFLCSSLAYWETYVPNCPQTAHPTDSPTLTPSYSPTGKSGKKGTVPPVSGKSGKSGSTSTGSPTADSLLKAKSQTMSPTSGGSAKEKSPTGLVVAETLDAKAAKDVKSPTGLVVAETLDAKAAKATSSPVVVVVETLAPSGGEKAKTRKLDHHGAHSGDYIDDDNIKEFVCYLAAIVWDLDPIICDPTDHPTVSPSDSPTTLTPSYSPTGKSGKSGAVPPVSGRSGKSGSTSTGSPTADSLLKAGKDFPSGDAKAGKEPTRV